MRNFDVVANIHYVHWICTSHKQNNIEVAQYFCCKQSTQEGKKFYEISSEILALFFLPYDVPVWAWIQECEFKSADYLNKEEKYICIFVVQKLSTNISTFHKNHVNSSKECEGLWMFSSSLHKLQPKEELCQSVNTTTWNFLINKIQRQLLSFSGGHTRNNDIILKLQKKITKTKLNITDILLILLQKLQTETENLRSP